MPTNNFAPGRLRQLRNRTRGFLFLLPFLCFTIIHGNHLYAQCQSNQRVDAGYELANNDVCEGSPVRVTNSSEENGHTNAVYYWSWGDGKVDTTYDRGNPPEHIYRFEDNEACNYNGLRVLELRLDVKVPGCAQYDHFVIKPLYVYFEPEPLFDRPSYICLPDLTVYFSDQSCAFDSLLTYEWNFGDPDSGPDNTSTDEAPSHTFSGPGEYNVKLKLTNFCGSKTETKKVIVLDEPIPRFELLPSGNGCAPTTLKVNNNSLAADEYNWQITPNDNTFELINDTEITDKEPQWRFKEAGLYTVSLAVTSDCGTVFLEQTLEILEPARVSLQEPSAACESLSYTPTVSYQGAIDSYQWTFTGGTPASSTDANPANISYDSPGNYPVIVKVESQCGNRSDTVMVRILEKEEVSLTSVDPLCSSSDTIRLQASPPGGVWTGTAVSADGLFDPGQATVGNNRLTYTYGPDACASQDDLVIEILESEPLNVGDPALFCSIDTEAGLTGFSPEGGVWSGEGVIDGNEGIVNPSQLGPGIFELRYTYVDTEQGCTSMATKEITIDQQPTLDLQPDLLSFCTGASSINLSESVQISAQPPGGSFLWEGPGISDPQNGILNTEGIQQEESLNILLTYSTAACRVTDSVEIQVVLPQEAVAGTDTTICLSDDRFELAGIPEGGVWEGPAVPPGASYIDLTSLPGEDTRTFTYTYTIFPNSTCTQTDEVDITFIDFSGVFAGNDQTVCASSGTLTLNEATPAGGLWSGEGILDPGSGTIDINALTAGIYILTYRVEDGNIACGAEDELTLTINPLPIGSLAVPERACKDETIALMPILENATSYLWEFGDGQSSTEMTPKHTYTNAGIFNIGLIASSSMGCDATFNAQIDVSEPPPVVAFAPDVREGCADLKVSFSNTTQGEVDLYVWDFGNGMLDSTENPSTVRFGTAFVDTTYHITLSASNRCGESSAKDSVRVFASPVARFGPKLDRFCSGDSILIHNSSYGNPISFAWRVDGVPAGNNYQLPPFQVITKGVTSRTVSLKVSNACGENESTRSIDILPTDVEAFFNLQKDSWCVGDSVNLTNLATPGVQVIYDFGDGHSSSLPDPVHAFSSAGTYTITQRAYGCGYDSTMSQIQVHPNPVAAFEALPRGCDGLEVLLSNHSEGAVDYAWSLESNPFSVEKEPRLQLDSPGNYEIYLTVSTAMGCIDDAMQNLSSFPVELLPQMDLLPISCHDMGDGVLEINDIRGGESPYHISLTNSNGYESEGNSFFGLGPGSYTLLIEDARGCSIDSAFSLTDPPALSLSINRGNTNLDLGQSLDLSLSHNVTEPQILWSPGEGLSCTDCPDPVARPLRNINYLVELQNGNGCLISESLSLQVDARRAVFFPNAFSPDNDGHNDIFRPLSEDPGVEWVQVFKVFDRWGELMYEANNFEPGDPDVGWNGRAREEYELEPGVFTWLAQVEYIDGEVLNYSGDVTLIR